MPDPFPTTPGGWRVVLMDAPWDFQSYDGNRRVPGRAEAGDPYETMTLAQLSALPLAAVCAKDCALFMWVIGSHLDQAIDLGRALGFRFRSDIFWWVKCRYGGWPEPGMGQWSMKQGEQLWLFTRGRPPRLKRGVQQIIWAERRAHSAKPDEQYRLIESVCGGPYLELFAERPREGWTSWGRPTGRFPDMLEGVHG